MIEIRFHGRGGQGAVVACGILANVFLKEGKYAQASSSFGAERRGAPVKAFIRVDDQRIALRGEIYEPDHIVILDSTLIKSEQVTAGLKKGGWVLINSQLESQAFAFLGEFRIVCCDANSIARKHGLGMPQSPIVNTTILGALAKVTGLVTLDTLSQAISEAVPTRKKENVAAATEAYEVVQTHDKV